MSGTPPPPIVQALVLCREIWHTDPRHEFVLVGPCSGVGSVRFPAFIPLSIFAHMTDARGQYKIGLRLVDAEDEIVWTMQGGPVVEAEDPLSPHRIVLRDIPIGFPAPGRYAVELLGNDMVLAQHSVWARERTK